MCQALGMLDGVLTLGGRQTGGKCAQVTLRSPRGSAAQKDQLHKCVQRWVGRVSVKSQMVNILGFGGHRVFVPTTQLCHCHRKQTQTICQRMGVACSNMKTGVGWVWARVCQPWCSGGLTRAGTRQGGLAAGKAPEAVTFHEQLKADSVTEAQSTLTPMTAS